LGEALDRAPNGTNSITAAHAKTWLKLEGLACANTANITTANGHLDNDQDLADGSGLGAPSDGLWMRFGALNHLNLTTLDVVFNYIGGSGGVTAPGDTATSYYDFAYSSEPGHIQKLDPNAAPPIIDDFSEAEPPFAGADVEFSQYPDRAWPDGPSGFPLTDQDDGGLWLSISREFIETYTDEDTGEVTETHFIYAYSVYLTAIFVRNEDDGTGLASGYTGLQFWDYFRPWAEATLPV
jgi:hypothetical protein